MDTHHYGATISLDMSDVLGWKSGYNVITMLIAVVGRRCPW